MSNILLVSETIEPTNQETYKALSKTSGPDTYEVRQKICKEISAEDIDWCDVVYFVRSTDMFQLQLAKYTKKLGKFIMFLLDDDFLSLDDKYGSDGRGYRTERKKCLKKILSYVDVLFATNKLIAEKYTAIGNIKRYYLTNTAMDISTLAKPQKKSEKTKIVIYENDGTTNMFDMYIRPIFDELCQQVGDKIEFNFMAMHPQLTEYENRTTINYIPHMSFDNFLKCMRESHFDIGLAPLDDIGFAKYKYFNKYIEYTRGGIAGIYSDCELYRQVITNGYNGVLCENTKDSWLNAIVDLVNNDDKRLEIANNAQTYAKDNFEETKIFEKGIAAIPEQINYKAPAIKAKKSKLFSIRVAYYLFRIRGWMGTFVNYVKTGNFRQLFARIKEKIVKKEK